MPAPVAAAGATAASSIAGPIMGGIGALLGFAGQRSANKRNIALAREQMAFQERMSNSAYQRAMADMRKAGLNPILAAKQPASTPGGQTTRVDSALGAGVNAFNTTASAQAQIKNLSANTNLTSAKALKANSINESLYGEKIKPEQRKINASLSEFGLNPALLSLATDYINQNKKEPFMNLIFEQVKSMGETIDSYRHALENLWEGIKSLKNPQNWYNSENTPYHDHKRDH